MWYTIPNMLQSFRQAKLPIVEIASDRARQPRAAICPFDPVRGMLNNNRILSLRSWSLADAIVRSSATREPGIFERVWLGTSQWMQTLKILELRDSGLLVIRPQMLLELRDMNHTAWSSNIGQAFCWLMGIKQLGFRHIVDFAEGCEALSIRRPRKDEVRPDFLAQNNTSASVHLLESKGHLFAINKTPDWKGDLREAFKQCDAGVSRLSGISVGSAYAIVTALQPPTGHDHSQIVYADPNGPSGREIGSEEFAAIATRHYAAWATCAGAIVWARALLEMREHEQVGSEIEVENRKFFFPRADVEVAGLELEKHGPFVPCPGGPIMMRGIDLEVAKTLARSPGRIRYFDTYPKTSDDEDYEILRDGTCLVSLERFIQSAPLPVNLLNNAPEPFARTGISLDRTSSMGLWTYSNNFMIVASELVKLNNAHTGGPAYYLVSHAIELSLKAFLRRSGISLDELKSNNKLGHNLSRYLSRAETLGLNKYLEITETDRWAIAKINDYC
jgi:hypothetical protein